MHLAPIDTKTSDNINVMNICHPENQNIISLNFKTKDVGAKQYKTYVYLTKNAGKWLHLDIIILTEVYQTQKDLHVCSHLQMNNTHKVQDIHTTFLVMKKLNKKEV